VKRFLFAIAFVGLLSTVFAAEARAARILYGTTGAGFGSTSTLVELDPDTGALVATIGPVGYLVNGLTWDATTSTLYGSTSVGDPSFVGLITIDTTTGAGTPVGTGWGPAFDWVGLTNITADSAGNLYGWWEGSDDLVRIDKTLGTAAVVGPSGIGTAAYGLAFDASDTLWLVQFGQAYQVDTTTGAATFSFSYASMGSGHHGDFDPDTGLYYGINTSGGLGPRSLDLVDFGTQTEILLLPTVDNLHTLAFVPVSSDTVPPDVTCSVTRRLLWPLSGGLFPVGLTAVATDDMDPSPAISVEVWSDEASAAGGAAVDPAYGLRLRSLRDWTGNGRVYLVIVKATDAGGNVGRACCTVVVPYAATGYWIANAYGQGASAEAWCTANGTPPAGWTQVLAPTPLP
jgi:hypothetical protein